MYCTHTLSVTLTLGVVVLLTVQEVRVSGRPAERAETPVQSPRDVIVEAKEGFGFNVVQRRLISALNPKPIVDTITEEEKYGNKMEHKIGEVIVNVVERTSNLVNSAFTLPQEAAKSGSRRLTDFLDMIGGKLVGLQK